MIGSSKTMKKTVSWDDQDLIGIEVPMRSIKKKKMMMRNHTSHRRRKKGRNLICVYNLFWKDFWSYFPYGEHYLWCLITK